MSDNNELNKVVRINNKVANYKTLRFASKTLVVVLTNACPVGCSHCCVSSRIEGVDLNLPEFKAWLSSTEGKLPFEGVTISGGEPFYRYRLLQKICHFLSSFDLKIGILTSGYWAISEEQTRKFLKPLVRSGLVCLGVSIDEPHLKKISINNVRRVIRVAKDIGLKVDVSYRYQFNKKQDDNLSVLSNLLGDVEDLVDEITSGIIQPIGREALNFYSNELPANERLKICPAYNLTIYPPNIIYGCCGGSISGNSPLYIGSLKLNSPNESYFKWRTNPFSLVVEVIGMTEILRFLRNSKLDMSLQKHYSRENICGLCFDIMNSKELVAEIKKQYLTEKNIRSLAIKKFLTTGDHWPLLNLRCFNENSIGNPSLH